jgi:hypothetical protein
MVMDYHVDFAIDEPKRRITVKAFGAMNSAAYVDSCIAFFKSVPDVCQYQRLVDLRETTGKIAFEDIIRLSTYWASSHQGAHPVRAATLVSTSEELNRGASMSLLINTHTLRSFLDEAEALTWLDEDLVPPTGIK